MVLDLRNSRIEIFKQTNELNIFCLNKNMLLCNFLVDMILANLANIRPSPGLRVCSRLRPRHFRARVSPGAGDTRTSDTGAGADLEINALHTAPLRYYTTQR